MTSKQPLEKGKQKKPMFDENPDEENLVGLWAHFQFDVPATASQHPCLYYFIRVQMLLKGKKRGPEEGVGKSPKYPWLLY